MLFGERDSRLYLAMINMTRALHPDLLTDEQWDNAENYIRCKIGKLDLDILDIIAIKWLCTDPELMFEHIRAISRY